MTSQYPDLASGRWGALSFVEQMANVGSEVERALDWRAKRHADYSGRALERALELIGLTLECSRSSSPRLRELARARELLLDYFLGPNEFGGTEASWRNYFSSFTFAARKNR